MAQHLLNTVTFTADQDSWTAGDKIEVFWDTTTELFVVKINDSIVTSGDVFVGTPQVVAGGIIDTAIGSYWTRTKSNYWYNNSGPDVYFGLSNYFPYAIKNTYFTNTPGEEGNGEVNDLSLAITSTLSPTGATATGAIYASASGTNTPFVYSLSNFVDDSGQASGTFSSLYPGTYTVTVRDSLGYFISSSVQLRVSTNDYTTRWEYQYIGDTGSVYKVEIKERGYSGSSTEITSGVPPFTLTIRGEGNDIYENTILAGTASLNILSSSYMQYSDIALGDDEKYKVVRSKQNGGSWDLIWQGFITTEAFSETLYSAPYITNIQAYDRLGDLKNLDFKIGESGIFDLGMISGDITQLQALTICLDKLNLKQGYRIACNIFDTTQTTTNNTPLNQTVINTDYFTKMEVSEGEIKIVTSVEYTDCATVVKAILKPYGAMILSWGGYWYIIRKKELKASTVNYVEYDTYGDYVTTGSWSPFVDFKSPDATTKFRWMGAQTWTNTRTFKNLGIKINAVVKEKGILGEASTKINNIIDNDPNGYGYYDEGTATTYLLYNDSITYDRNDKIKLSVKYIHSIASFANLEYGNLPPYIPLKWMLKVGTKYVDVGGNWTTSETLNQYFIDTFNKDDDFEITLPFDDVGVTTEEYKLRMYIPSIYDYNIAEETEAEMITTLQAITTTTSNAGARLITRRERAGSFGWIYYYYELQELGLTEDAPNIVRPTDYNVSTNKKSWQLVTTRAFESGIAKPVSTHNYKSIKLSHLPSGLEPPTEIVIKSTTSLYNKLDYEYELDMFDQNDNINNDERIYKNILKYTDGTPTGAWSEVGGSLSQSIQLWLLNDITIFANKPRRRINGTFKTDNQVEITPLNVLRDPNDSNRLYYGQGITMNWNKGVHSGELIEIGNDDDTTASAFTSGFKQSGFR